MAIKNWDNVRISPEFSAEGVDCYSLTGGDFVNRYYIATQEDTRRLLNSPEVIGYEVYSSMLPTTAKMMRYFKDHGQVSHANILSILRGALNFPLEEACFRSSIRVHDISFLSSERVFSNHEITGLEIKYSKLAMVKDSTLLIGDIVASGETMIHCLNYVINCYRSTGVQLRNIIYFTIGGAKGIEIMEELTKKYREFWPEFEGFICVYYDGVFNTYQDPGVTGIQVKDVDFYWKGGILAPKYRSETLKKLFPLFEKCTIYDGGARRYEIHDHADEVLDYWKRIEERADLIDMHALIEDRLGYALPISFSDWVEKNHYQNLDTALARNLFADELNFLNALESQHFTIRGIARKRIEEFTAAVRHYML